MIVLNTQFNDDERKILEQCAGKNFEILSEISGDSFVLNLFGSLSYNECFDSISNEYFAKQKYEKVIPYRVIKFYNYYLMNLEEEKYIWYRGRKDSSGNWEYECYLDSLEEAFISL